MAAVLALALAALLSVASWGGAASAAPVFSLDMHHRFSDTVRRWADARSAHRWPDKGTVDYYAALAHHDRAFRGRSLSESAAPLAFSDGNDTVRVSSLGFLHYAVVSLGTPAEKFFVALDTGSDVSWVPCDCKECAPVSGSTYGFNLEFNIYNPKVSMTSRAVPCNNSLCELKCSLGSEQCPYQVAYVSANTSSSGYLVEDVLYLTTEDSRSKVVEARLTFGCGKVQTGSFLGAAAPNGLFGLGMEKVSVPSILSSAGLTSDSFSMCFGRDGFGRISFGDKGSSDQAETPFNLKSKHSTYNINVTGISVGNTSIPADFAAVVDTGTSFTYLKDPFYSQITESFNAKAQDKRFGSISQIPFEYCYYLSPNQTTIEMPGISFTTKGGSEFPVSDPIILISIKQNEYVYCLGVIKGGNMNVIGQNFMTGLRIVFDRERMILGWKKTNCYDIEDTSSLPVDPPNSSTPAYAPGSYSPEVTKETGNNSQVTVLIPPNDSRSSKLNSFTSLTIVFLLFLTIL